MKAPRNILKHVSVETALAKRKCHRDKNHRISMGERCVVIKEAQFSGSKNYCKICAKDILSSAENNLSVLRRELDAL